MISEHYAAAVIFDDEGRILLCKRSAEKKIAPNRWHLPGGHIEIGENAIQAVKRELKEELDLNSIAVFPTKVKITYDNAGKYTQTHVFLVEITNAKPRLINNENSEFKFVYVSELKDYIEPHLVDDNIRAVRVALSLKKRKTSL